MQKAVTLVSLLVLGWTWTPEALPLLSEPLFPTQENFDLTQFLGIWYDVAFASTCPHMRHHRGDSAIGKLVLESGTTEGKIKATRTSRRHGTCKEMSVDYELTSTPGRFFYHITRWAADVDAYVVHTNYNEYAIVIMTKLKSSGDKSTSLKLYSRTKSVRDTVLEDFKALVRQQGMADDTIGTRQDKGDCVPGELVQESSTLPEQRSRRSAELSKNHELEVDGSGDDSTKYFPALACFSPPFPGPCFGLDRRYYYNSSSMTCELFTYGGCMSNHNNFETERACLQRCRTAAVCRLPMVAKPCTGQPPIWAFDSTVGLCVPYKQGFCQANGNKFYSKAECEEYCKVVNTTAEPELLAAN